MGTQKKYTFFLKTRCMGTHKIPLSYISIFFKKAFLFVGFTGKKESLGYEVELPKYE